jgi:hypothetical protein
MRDVSRRVLIAAVDLTYAPGGFLPADSWLLDRCLMFGTRVRGFAGIAAAAKEGDEVNLPGFGKFKVKDSEARQGRNPAIGETIEIAASRKLGFTPAKQVRDALAG